MDHWVVDLIVKCAGYFVLGMIGGYVVLVLTRR